MNRKIKQKIIEFFHKKQLDFVENQIFVEKSKNFGDFSTNIALVLAKKNNLKPLELANLIKDSLSSELTEIEKIEVIPPGFINFYVTKTEFTNVIKTILDKGENYGRIFEGQKINIEFVSANPTGFLHLGHLRSAIIGDVLANILAFCGNEVLREYYVNDFGNQIDKLTRSVFAQYQKIFGDFLLPEDAYLGADIVIAARKIYDIFGKKFQFSNLEDQEIYTIFRENSLNFFLNEIKTDLLNLSIKIDKFSYESQLFKDEKVTKNIQKLPFVYKNQGATWLKTSEFGDQKDRVLVKKDGSFTYFSSDIAYHLEKINDKFKPQKLINIWGADHIGYVDRMKAAMKIVKFDNKLEIILYQLVKLIKNNKEFKMSKRKGQTFTVKEFLEIAKVDSIRYFISERSFNSLVEFDIDLASSVGNQNPLFLIQYAYARGCQLLTKSELNAEKITTFSSEIEIKIISKLKQFEEIVQKISKNYKINLLNKYLLELANLFNFFYSNSRIIGSNNSNDLLCLTKAVTIVLKIGLNLLGIEPKERI
ncbi:arginine--tRNA ligase [Mycoplasma sp. 'Moose RK']|uniref:arginine--tRNA ligase n=1 Tax=Mycoplasma sp. 'Moose RK' TaxID=2780095 RepID=UPI0018C1F254|nr:arginine--tRNA ligase [Mycoplasma sp. 'Moose RK']MBG0730508.1 arginine--tRNA ligase [Mycoplasma sp. 'Moose RK']